MLSPRWQKVIKDLWGNKLRTSLVVASIAIGVFAVGMIATVDEMISKDMNRAYALTNPAHATLYTDFFSDDLVQTVEAMPEVVAAEGRHSVTVRFSTSPGQWRDLELIVLANYDNVNITKVFPQAGAWPPARKDIIIERASASFIGLTIGDTLLIQTPQGKQRTVRISGLAHDMNNPPAMFVGRGYGYITNATLEWLGFTSGYSQMLVRVPADKATSKEAVQQIADKVTNKIERTGRTVQWAYVPEPGKHPVDDVLKPMAMILSVLGMLSLFLSGFLVINTISAVLTQQVKQIGIMKTIGATNQQIAQLYFLMVLVFSLLALALGVPLGAAGGRALGGYMASLLNFDLPNNGIPLHILLLEIGVGVLVPFLAALWPVISGARITVREALNAQAMAKRSSTGQMLSRFLEVIQGVSRPTMLSIRNTFRRKGRLILTMATLTLGGAIFIAVLSVHASLGRTLDDALNYWNYDIEVGFSRSYRIDQLINAVLRVPGTVEAECWGQYSVRRIRSDGREGENIAMIAPPIPTTLLNPIVTDGRWLLPSDENAVVLNTDALKIESDIRVGKTITLKVNGRESSWKVVGLVRGILMGPIMYANYQYAARNARGVGRAGWVYVVTDKHDAQSQSQLAKRLEADLKQNGFQVRTTQTIGNLRQMVQSQFNILVVFLLIMAVLLAVVGGLGLMGTMSINVLERTREIGVMRAIGASNWSMVQVFLVEGVFIGFLSWVLGVLLALPLSRLLSNIVGESMLRAPLSYTFSVVGAGLWLVIVTVLAGLASLLPAWKAARLTVRDVLAYE